MRDRRQGCLSRCERLAWRGVGPQHGRGGDVDLDHHGGIRGGHVPQDGVFGAGQQRVLLEDAEEEVGVPVQEECAELRRGERNLKEPGGVRGGAADEVIDDAVLVPCLDTQSC